ncbi:MAG: hypothetical protein HDR80_03835 [Bacteroides sp.]|nr:hypothetical protein [Bacteroides sp.]
MALRPKNVNGSRIKAWNDYGAARRVYLLTLDKAEGAGEWSEIVEEAGYGADERGNAEGDGVTVGKGEDVRCELTYEGSEVEAGVQVLRREMRGMKVLEYMVMPDHLHCVVCGGGGDGVNMLSEFVMTLKREVSRRIAGTDCRESVFAPGMHHRILRPHDEEHLRRMFEFVRSNPGRRLRRDRAGSFRQRGWVVAGSGEEFEFYGNPDLLEEPEIEAVRVSRSYSEEELKRRKRGWMHTVENGGVLVSPFVSAAERRVRDWGAANGGRLVVVLHEGIGPNFTVGDSFLPLLDEGRLLVIGANEYPPGKAYASRADCVRMNDIAAMVAAGRLRLK